MTPPFTPEQEARLREIVREEIDADRVIRVAGPDDRGPYVRAVVWDRSHNDVEEVLAEIREAKTSNRAGVQHA